MLRNPSKLGHVLNHFSEASVAAGAAHDGLSSLFCSTMPLAFSKLQLRWASKKQGGSTQNGRESQPKHLGCKLFDNNRCQPGNIIVRQRGTRFYPGENVGMGTDHTLFAKAHGFVRFETDARTKRRTISVVQAKGRA
uniref:Large subunit ribosomal protein L27 n=1 Tax=Tetraselmis sp. GSL018 TaxID=582737 RepID=A0A061RDP7_9CHLO